MYIFSKNIKYLVINLKDGLFSRLDGFKALPKC